MKILLVEDDQRIAIPLLEDLRHQWHVVDSAVDGLMAWEMLQTVAYDVVILDLMLPRLDGLSLCQQIRQAGLSTLVLMLTAKDTLSDKVAGLDAGADDYLVKPFELDELSARLRALMRRSHAPCCALLQHGGLVLNPETREVFYAQVPLSLTPKEFLLLECFLRSPERVLTKESLLDRLWELDSLSSQETVKTHLTNLRRKLRTAGAGSDFIQTIYGVGYRLGGQSEER